MLTALNYIQIVLIRLAHRLYTDVQYFFSNDGFPKDINYKLGPWLKTEYHCYEQMFQIGMHIDIHAKKQHYFQIHINLYKKVASQDSVT